MSKHVCELCQSKLEFTRQYFEQIYVAHIKLLALYREEREEEEGVSVEEEMVEYMRSFEAREVKVSSTEIILSQPREIVKCEPELPDLHEEAHESDQKPGLRNPKHFLDELLDVYDDMDSGDDKIDWGGKVIDKKGSALLVPPPLKRCGVCGLVSTSHLENITHWGAEHPDTSIVYR